MNATRIIRTNQGFTGWDLVIVLTTTVLLIGFLLPMVARSRGKSARINCVSNLKQVGLGFRMWANDNREKFPFQVSTNNGGTLEHVGSVLAAPHFQAIAVELNSPKVLTCPNDSARKRTTSWAELGDRKHMSYFVGLSAAEGSPTTVLSGDRTFSTNGQPLSGLATLGTQSKISWAKGIHAGGGNVVFADGSAHQLMNGQTLAGSNTNFDRTARLVLPAP